MFYQTTQMKEGRKGSIIVKFGKLFEPVRIGSMELKNRLIVPAMGTKKAKSL